MDDFSAKFKGMVLKLFIIEKNGQKLDIYPSVCSTSAYFRSKTTDLEKSKFPGK